MTYLHFWSGSDSNAPLATPTEEVVVKQAEVYFFVFFFSFLFFAHAER